MKYLSDLFARNRAWAAERTGSDPEFFSRLAHLQRPDLLWIGCSDSRVPANEIVGLAPGELFVHRNVANVVVHSDLNCLSVVHVAVEDLRVPEVIVCGHYGCGGVTAAWRKRPLGLMDHWLRHVDDVARKHRNELAALRDEARAVNRLCELNALEQAVNVCRTDSVRDAWARGQALTVHAWIYCIRDGLLHDLGFAVASTEVIERAYEEALRAPSPAASR